MNEPMSVAPKNDIHLKVSLHPHDYLIYFCPTGQFYDGFKLIVLENIAGWTRESEERDRQEWRKKERVVLK